MMPLRSQLINTNPPGTPSLRASRSIPDHGQTLFTEVACCPNTVIAGTLFRSLLHCAFYPLGARRSLNFANSSRSLGGPQTCELPFGTFLLTQVGAKKCSKARLAKSSSYALYRSYSDIFLGEQAENRQARHLSMAQTCPFLLLRRFTSL
jgi:hypothetical protein